MKRAARIYERKPEPFSAKVVVTVTEAMRKQVEAEAAKAGLPQTEWVRYLISEALERG